MKSDIKKKKKGSNSPINTKPQITGVYETGRSVATIKKTAKNYKFSKSLSESLKRKSKNANIPIKTVLEVFKRGILSWTEDQKLDKVQLGFNRVNSFIANGVARKLDADLIEAYAIAVRSSKAKSGYSRVPDTKFETEESAKRYGDKYHTDKHGAKFYKVIEHPKPIKETRDQKLIKTIRGIILK